MPDVTQETNTPKALIERMTEHDLLEVVAIEEMSGLSHWGWDAYHLELQQYTHSILLVARNPDNRSVIAFIVARQIADEIHVNNVAVLPDYRRRGIGKALLRTVLAWGRERNANQAVLEVRAGNQAAQRLYQACGFEVIGRRRRYYAAPLEDALLMAVSFKGKP